MEEASTEGTAILDRANSDLLYFNVLVRDDRISAVLDWGSSMFGDFLWDLAWFTFWQPWYRNWSGVDFR